MSEFRRDQKEEQYSDKDRDQETFSVFEETYRDGSAKNECWNSGDKPIREESDEKDPEELPAV
ncbi:MAG: hypothetical protein IKH18_01615 [Clostridia bacterium]|nr:hypothetical protein [Clostridia bacterium]